MNRRRILSSLALASLFPAVARAADQPWASEILSTRLDDGRVLAGLEIKLQTHWKTYWRVPGQGGVPPFIEVKGKNVKAFRFDCPTPSRLPSEAGESIGYVGNVLFPIMIDPIDAAKPVEADLSAFFGVCEEVCIPAQIKGRIASQNDVDGGRLQKWQALVPKQNSNFVKSARALLVNGKTAVRFELSQALEDIFVEGNDLHYFKAPSFEGNFAILGVAGAKSIDELKKAPLRVTGKLPIGGLEQMVTVV